MGIPFTKMHGLGNDFVLMRSDDRPVPAPEAISRLADRRTGIGFDQLLWLEPPRSAGADVYYRVFNGDGSEAEQCGNGARCIARLLATENSAELCLEHVGGLSRARIQPDGEISVEMGVPDFDPAAIPFLADAPQECYQLTVEGEIVDLHVVSMGNPHAVIPVGNVDIAPVERLGPALERHDRFPNRANIGFMQVVTPDHVRLRVYERGVGETRACGTGACAAAVVGRSVGQLDERVVVELPGGRVTVRWEGPGQPAWLTGEAVTVFEGTVEV